MKPSLSITLLCLSFALLWCCSSAKEVYLNSSALLPCAVPDVCWFLDPSLWVNEAAPEINDEVYIQDNVDYIYLFFNQTFNLTSITMANDIEFKFIGNANLNVQNVSLIGSVIVYFENNAQIVSNFRTYLGNQSTIVMMGGAYAQDGEFFMMEPGATFNIIGGYFGVHSKVVHIRGDLMLSPVSAMFVSTSPALYFENQLLTFAFTPIIYNAYYINSTITFSAGLRSSSFSYLQSSSVTVRSALPSNTMSAVTVDAGSAFYIRGVSSFTLANPNITGSLYISSSNVVVQTPSFGVTALTLAGKSSLNSSTMVIRTLQYAQGENNEPVSVTLLSDAFHMIGDFYAPSTDIYATQMAYFRGVMTISGAVNVGEVLLIEDSNITVGEINVGYDNTNRLVSNESDFDIARSTLIADNVRIGDNGTLDTSFSTINANLFLHPNSTLDHQNTTLIGNVFNGGLISIHHLLSIHGNYTQWGHGKLLSHLDLANRSSGYLSVSGHANLNGTLQYRIETARVGNTRMQLPVVQTGSGINGKFYSETVNAGELVDKTSGVLYSEHDVYMTFGPAKSNAASLWWVWLIVAIGIVGVIGLIVLVVKTMRGRKDYVPV